MYFSKLPEGFPGAGVDMIVSVADCDPELITEVRIEMAGEIRGVKRFRGEKSYDINTSCYLRGSAEVKPTVSGEGFFDMDMRMPSFTVSAVQYDPADDTPAGNAQWIYSGEIFHTAGSLPSPVKTDLSGFRDHLEIRNGERVEIPFISTQRTIRGTVSFSTAGQVFEIYYSHIVAKENGMCSLVLDPAVLEKETGKEIGSSTEIMVTIQSLYNTDQTAFAFTKQVRARNNCTDMVRLCWVNKYGTVDYHTFSPVCRQTLKVEKNRVLSAAGYGVSYLEETKTMRVQTSYTTPEYLSQIAEVLCSHQVWMITEGQAVPVDILSQSTEFSTDGPGRLILEFRTA